MTMVGGFDVHRKQLTFDYVDTETGEVYSGQIRPATRLTLRRWLAEHCPDGAAEFALEGCTGWRYVVEELTAIGAVAHLADPAETAGLRGPKKRAKSDRTDARLLRTLLHSVFDQPDAQSVAAQYDRIIDALADKLPKVAEHLDAAREDLLAFTAFPQQIWRQIWSNNPVR